MSDALGRELIVVEERNGLIRALRLTVEGWEDDRLVLSHFSPTAVTVTTWEEATRELRERADAAEAQVAVLRAALELYQETEEDYCTMRTVQYTVNGMPALRTETVAPCGACARCVGKAALALTPAKPEPSAG